MFPLSFHGDGPGSNPAGDANSKTLRENIFSLLNKGYTNQYCATTGSFNWEHELQLLSSIAAKLKKDKDKL